MGYRTRHFCALMKKNWIIWKRTLGASICELFCPVALMAIMCLARALISQETFAPSSNMSKSYLMAPLPNMTALMANQTTGNATSNRTAGGNTIPSSFVELQRLYASYGINYGGLAGFSETNLVQRNPVSAFFPKHCIANRLRNKEMPVIGYAGSPKYMTPLIQDFQKLLTLQKEVIKLTQAALMLNETLRVQLAMLGLDGIIDVNFYLKNFTTHEAIEDYLVSPDYEQDDDHPGMCFGFSVTERSENEVDVKMAFSGQFQDAITQSIPSQLDPVWDEFAINADTSSFNMYSTQGYALVQNWIANHVLRVQAGNPNATVAFTLVPTKTDKYVSDDFAMIMTGMLPFFMLLIYILPMYRLISAVVSEKETKARESMKMMGLNDYSYWLSWFVYYTLIVTLISILVIIVLSINVLKYSSRGVVFLFFWMYGMSLFGLAISLQSFFSRARVAAITGTLVYFGTSFINVAVADKGIEPAEKNLASLLTPVAVNLGSAVLAQFETSGIGLRPDNIRMMYNNYSMGGCLVSMFISLLLFFWVGIYLDNTLPSAYGLRKGWCFCLTPSFWCSRRGDASRTRKMQVKDKDDENEANFETKYMDPTKFEPASRELAKQEQENKILKVSDLMKTFENGFKAVRGINVKMYNGQIFALLGHNGAGKTTMISMLTGLIQASCGHASVFGTDLFGDMENVRQFLGVCPQHDVLFDLLTPEEHLDIFCDFKGVDKAVKQEEIKKMLIDVDVLHHKDTMASQLSGGSRRKLSVAIALIGGSKLVLLDEPTSGMDLSARRKLWNMLKSYKNNRIIILTTHYMDEADILGDRIGIMTGGKLICLGSSLFLKTRYGVGYYLTMVKKSKENNQAVVDYVRANLGPEVQRKNEVSSEIVFQIPTALSSRFDVFFSKFDQDLDSLGIRSYGISVTTLEQVFLSVGHGDDAQDATQLRASIKESQIDAEFKAFKASQEDQYTISDPKHQKSGMTQFLQHLTALFLKRFFIYKRNRKGLIVEVFVPVLLVIIGFAFSKVEFFRNQPNREFVPELFPMKQRILSNQQAIIQGTGNQSAWNIAPSTLLGYLPSSTSAFDINFRSYPTVSNTSNATQLLAAGRQFDDQVFDYRVAEPYSPYRYGSYFVYEANNLTKQFKAAVFLNITSQDVAAAYPAFLYEAVIRAATGKKDFKMRLTTTPYPVTQKLRNRRGAASGFFTSFIVSIAFALIPSVVISFILNEREKSLKHMQVISGMNLGAYWVSNLIFDIFKAMVPSVIVIGLIYAFGLDYPCTWLLFLLYPLGVVPFTYVMSFLFTTENVAQTITIFLHFVFAGIGAIVVFVLQLIESTRDVGDILKWVLRITPSYCLTSTIMFDSGKQRLLLLRPELRRDSDWDIDLQGGNVLVMMVHFGFWLIVLALIEMGAFNWVLRLINLMPKNRIPPKPVGSLYLDEDVAEEEARIVREKGLKVRVDRFRKVYPGLFRDPVQAVERTSFGLDYGECFALLGINGAGKSTTFKALTREIEPTQGVITIAGFDAQREFDKARKLIGYCPQRDAIFELMTVEEHLEYYGRIKGIPQPLRQRLIERQINDMNLAEHRAKPAGTLSGGNKRKLSVAMAILGNPPIILLDEPSAGMDPEARQFMWQVIARISQQRKQSAVILTTHSMEEAEALSTKMGIMVKGGIFRCLGSSQHIKNKFGTGYEIEVKVSKLQPEEASLLAAKFGFGLTKSTNDSGSGELVSFQQVLNTAKEKGVDQFLMNELHLGGIGEDLVKEANENGGMINYHNFVQWIYVEEAGMHIVNQIVQQFGTVEILEHYSDYYKFRVPRGDKSIGFVFGYIERSKADFHISEYSVSQTTLEQIFQTFANMKFDDDSRKLKFKRSDTGSRAQIYTDSALETHKSIVTANGPPAKQLQHQ